LRWPDQNLADKRLRGLRHQHGDSVSDVLGLKHFLGVLAGVRAELGFGRAGANHGYTNIVAAQFFRHGIAEPVQSPLGSSVGGAVGQGVFSGEGRDVDDVSGIGPNHERGESPDGVIDAAQVGVEDAIPVVGQENMQRLLEAADAGVVDQDVEAAECAVHAGGDVFELVQDGDVAGDYFGFSAGVENGHGGSVEGGLGAAAEHSGGAELGQLTGDGGANTAACPGDDSDLSD